MNVIVATQLKKKENFNQDHFKVMILIKIYIIFREEVNEKSDKAYRYDREVFFLHNPWHYLSCFI